MIRTSILVALISVGTFMPTITADTLQAKQRVYTCMFKDGDNTIVCKKGKVTVVNPTPDPTPIPIDPRPIPNPPKPTPIPMPPTPAPNPAPSPEPNPMPNPEPRPIQPPVVAPTDTGTTPKI